MATKKEDTVLFQSKTIVAKTRDGELQTRVIETSKGRFFDCREYVDAETFQGFTRKGLRLDLAGLAKLEKVIAEAKKVLAKK